MTRHTVEFGSQEIWQACTPLIKTRLVISICTMTLLREAEILLLFIGDEKTVMYTVASAVWKAWWGTIPTLWAAPDSLVNLYTNLLAQWIQTQMQCIREVTDSPYNVRQVQELASWSGDRGAASLKRCTPEICARLSQPCARGTVYSTAVDLTQQRYTSTFWYGIKLQIQNYQAVRSLWSFNNTSRAVFCLSYSQSNTSSNRK